MLQLCKNISFDFLQYYETRVIEHEKGAKVLNLVCFAVLSTPAFAKPFKLQIMTLPLLSKMWL